MLERVADTDDALAMPALAKDRFLAEIEHPNIIRVYDFVRAPDPRTGRQHGYLVLEYIGGMSLRQLAQRHAARGGTEPLSVRQVVVYGLEILDAVGYLHRRGLLFGYLTPDNVIVTGDRLKLALPVMRRSNDRDSPLRSTVGYAGIAHARCVGGLGSLQRGAHTRRTDAARGLAAGPG